MNDGYISVLALRMALRTCIERLDMDPRDYFFYAVDGDQHVAWVDSPHPLTGGESQTGERIKRK